MNEIEELKQKIKDAVADAIAEVSCDTHEDFFNGDIHFSVCEGWTSIEVTSINK